MDSFWSVHHGVTPSPWDTVGPEKNDLRRGLRLARYVECLPSRQGQLERAIAELVATVQAQARRIQELERTVVTPAKESPIQRWRKEHADELRARAGKTVAIHPQRGIVAEGELLDVIRAVRAQGLSKETVIERLRPLASRR